MSGAASAGLDSVTDPIDLAGAPRSRWPLFACVCGLLLAAAGSWLRFLWEGTLRLDTHTTPFLTSLFVSGSGLVLACVGLLKLGALPREYGVRSVLRWSVAVQCAALLAVPLTSTDVYTNLAIGMLSGRGLSPYSHLPPELAGSPGGDQLLEVMGKRWVNDPSPYGPLFTPVVRAAAFAGRAVGSPFFGALIAFKLLLWAAVLAALAIAAGHLVRTGRADAASTLALLGMTPLVAWELAATGHNDALLFLSLCAFFSLAAQGHEKRAAAVLAAGVAVKYAVAPLLLLYLVLLLRGSFRRALLAGLCALAVGLAAFAPELHDLTLQAVTPMVGGQTSRHAHSLIDLVCVALDALSLPRASALAFTWLSRGSGLFCAAVLGRAAWRARTLSQLGRGWLEFLFALYLTAPWFHPWYLCWALPALLVEEDAGWRSLVGTYAALQAALWIAPLDPVTNVALNGWALVRLRGLWRAQRATST